MAEMIPPKKRMQREQVPMPEQEPKERICNFKEVPLGYTQEQAIYEAQRCLQCKNHPCVSGCPAEINIPKFIEKIVKEDFSGAYLEILKTDDLPAITGRVCPQEEQCQQVCILEKQKKPIAIGRLERFVADWARKNNIHGSLPKISKKEQKVAIVGSGPAGLTCAADLAKLGYEVTLFEALHQPGGVLVYGIPEFRLPKSIVKYEVKEIEKLGVKVITNFVVGATRSVDELTREFDAIFLANGAGAPRFMNIPGENLNDVYSANELLTRSNLMKAYAFPEYDTPIKIGKRAATIGAGNVAMDSARTALRLGAENSYIIYRRSRAEMPARNEELEHAEEEGIQFRLLTNPVSIDGDERGWVKSLTCLRYELGEPDASGRRSPIAIPGSEFEIPMDTVVVAIGQGPNPLVTTSTPGLVLNKRGNIVADEETLMTSKPGVFAGGDIVTGAATVILAMGAGKKAACGINEYLKAAK